MYVFYNMGQIFSLPLNSFCERSENWLTPYLADCGAVESEFKYACRFVAFCNDTNDTLGVVKLTEEAAKCMQLKSLKYVVYEEILA